MEASSLFMDSLLGDKGGGDGRGGEGDRWCLEAGQTAELNSSVLCLLIE